MREGVLSAADSEAFDLLARGQLLCGQQLLRARRPGRVAVAVGADLLRDRDLLLAAGLVRRAGAAVCVPGGLVELQPTGYLDISYATTRKLQVRRSPFMI